MLCLIRLSENDKATIQITCGQEDQFDFYCSAVGCVKIVKNVKVLNRVNQTEDASRAEENKFLRAWINRCS